MILIQRLKNKRQHNVNGNYMKTRVNLTRLVNNNIRIWRANDKISRKYNWYMRILCVIFSSLWLFAIDFDV